MAQKPSYKQAREARGTATMIIEPMPKTSFTDENLDSKATGDAKGNKVSSDSAAPGGSTSPLSNAPADLRGDQLTRT